MELSERLEAAKARVVQLRKELKDAVAEVQNLEDEFAASFPILGYAVIYSSEQLDGAWVMRKADGLRRATSPVPNAPASTSMPGKWKRQFLPVAVICTALVTATVTRSKPCNATRMALRPCV